MSAEGAGTVQPAVPTPAPAGAPPSSADQWRQRIQLLLSYGLLLLIGWLLYRVLAPFLVPLGWAAILAICCYPVHRRLAARLSPTLAAACSTTLLALLLVVPTVLLGIALGRQAAGATDAVQAAFDQGVPQPVQHAWDWAAGILPLPPLDEAVGGARAALKDAGGAIAKQAGSVLGAVLIFLVDLAIMLLALFFAFRDGPQLAGALHRVLPLEQGHSARLTRELHDLIHGTVTAGVLVAAAQGFLGGLLFLILGIPSPLFWGVVMGFLSLFPLLGSWPVWAPAALWLMATDHVAKGIVLAVCGVVLVGGIDNVLRPILLGGRTRMGMLPILLSLLGGVAAFGFIGLVFGPVVMAVALSLYRTYLGEDGEDGDDEPAGGSPAPGAPPAGPAAPPAPAA